MVVVHRFDYTCEKYLFFIQTALAYYFIVHSRGASNIIDYILVIFLVILVTFLRYSILVTFHFDEFGED